MADQLKLFDDPIGDALVLARKRAQYRKDANKFRARNPEKAKEHSAKARAKNREKARVATAKWRVDNPGRASAAMLARYYSDPEKFRKASLEWQKNNPEKSAIRRNNYRARKYFNGGKLSPGLFDMLFYEQGGLCTYCGNKLAKKKTHMDHFMPLKLGGTNTDDNIVLSCARCNCSKRCIHPIKFMERIGIFNVGHIPTIRADNPAETTSFLRI